MNQLFIGTYTWSKRPGELAGIHTCFYDPVSGEIGTPTCAAETVNPSFLILAPGKERLYAVNEISGHGGGTASAYAIDPSSGSLSLLSVISTHGLAPCHLCLDPRGEFLLVANYDNGNVAVLPVLASGGLGEATQVIQLSGSGPHPLRQVGPHAHMVGAFPVGELFYVIDLGTDRIWLYSLDRDQTRLIPAATPFLQLPAGSGPRHLAIHPSLPYFYLLNELESSLSVFTYAEQAEIFEERQTISTLPAGYRGEHIAAGILVAPSGRFVYASNRGPDDLVIFAVDDQSGALELVGHQPTLGRTPRFFTILPDGNTLLAANQDSDAVVSFHVDPASGGLTPTGHAIQVPKPVCLVIA
jgi:6-phosphogluconolactonase